MPAAASGVRIAWSDLPPRVQAWVTTLLGSPVVSARSQSGGFSPGTADRLRTANGGRAFLKAVSPAQNEGTPNLHRREAEVLAQLPPSPRVPRLLGRYDDGEWVALLAEDVEGHTPRVPWDTVELEASLAALGELAETHTPSPLPQLGSLVEWLRYDFGGWRRIQADPPVELDRWTEGHLAELVELADRGLAALAGDTLVHLDVRADNLIVGPDGFVSVVDWPWATNGAAWVDRLLLIVNVDLYGGHDPDALVRQHLGSDVGDDVVTAALAGLCSYFTDIARQPPVPGLPTVRAFQSAQAQSTLAWLRRRLEGS